jgi:hypothetical protein
MRPTSGINYQATYTWSRSLGVTAAYRDLLNQGADYTRLDSDRTHMFRSYGTFDLPFGPGQALGDGTSGVLARVIEGWSFGTIFNIASGEPLNIDARRTLYAANGTPDIVGAFPRQGEAVWPLSSGDTFGNYFSEQYRRVRDPGCAGVAANLQTWCTNTALADASGSIVLRNAAPGELGTLGLATIEGPGSWDLDANLQKSFRIDESKRLVLRVDAANLFNHATPVAPNLNINSGTFGEIDEKDGNRTLQAQVRFEF